MSTTGALQQVTQARMAAALGDVAGLRAALLAQAEREPRVVFLAQALILLDQGRPLDALATLEMVGALPGEAGQAAWVGRARALIDLQQPQAAVGLLQEVLASQAQASPDLLTTLARGLLHSDEPDLAETILEAVLSAVPRHDEARYGLGVLRLLQGRPGDAVAQLQVAQHINPRRREVYQALARAWRMLHRPAEGVAMLEVLLAENALVASPGLSWELVELYAATGEAEGWTRWLRTLEGVAVLDPSARVALGRHWAALGRVGELRRLLIGLGSGGGERVAARLLAGMAEALEGERVRALAYFQAAVAEQPGLWIAQERAGRLLLDAGADPAHARPYVAAAVALAPQTPEVVLLRALYAQATGEPGATVALTTLAAQGGIRAELRVRAQHALDADVR